MQWWNDFLNWLGSDAGWRVLTTAVFPFIAIVIAGVIAALIGRGATHRLISHQDRELQASAVSAMIEAGRSATMWSSLSSGAQSHSDSQFNAADIRVRLLPLAGATAAADWATHEIRAMRRDSAGFSFQAEQTFADYRDRLLEWQRRPGRARKLFALDLERFRFEDSSADAELVEQQRRWAAQQAAAEQAAVATDSVMPVAAAAAPVAATAVIEPEPVASTGDVEEPESLAATQDYAMPVAASSHVNEHERPADEDSSPDAQADSETADSTDTDMHLDTDAPEPQPHVESEEDPEDELPGVEIAEPVEHDEPENYAPSSEWNGAPTQALPLIEPENPYAPAHDDDENRSH